MRDEPCKYHKHAISQQTRDVELMLVECWASVEDYGPTFNQYWFNVSCLRDVVVELTRKQHYIVVSAVLVANEMIKNYV